MTARIACLLLALTVTLANENAGRAQVPFFMGLGDLPGGIFESRVSDVSADGSVVVGSSSSPLGSELFRWTPETGMIGLGGTDADRIRVSADGSTIVGNTFSLSSGDTAKPFRWSSDSGIVGLPPMLHRANGVSGDGSIIAGESFNPTTGRSQAARWTEVEGVELLPFDNFDSTVAWDVSADGSVFVVNNLVQRFPFQDQLMVWSADAGITHLDVGASDNSTLGISFDGKVVAGASDYNGAWLWRKETGHYPIDWLPDGKMSAVASVSGDGSIAVGDTGFFDPSPDAYIWDAARGSRYVANVLVDDYDLGMSLAGWHVSSAVSISGDGRTIVGHGVNPTGKTEAWIVYLGPPTGIAGDYNADGVVDAADYVLWRKYPGTLPGYGTWRANFGRTAPSDAAASASARNSLVPEPASAVLLAGCAVSMLRGLRRQPARPCCAHRSLHAASEDY